MNVFIARDGSVIGEYPRGDLEAMAQRGELEMEDHFWQEGMEDWLPLPQLIGPEAWLPPPPPAPPRSPLVYLGIGLGAALLVGALVYFFVLPDRPEEAHGPVFTEADGPPLTGAEARAVRDTAAADLRARIERLPSRAAPPGHNFYYDVRVNMQRTLSGRAPWLATMRGFENVVDPATGETLRRTEFTLQAEYRDQAWYYRGYSATTTDLKADTVLRVEESPDSPTPPAIAGIMGLKRQGQ